MLSTCEYLFTHMQGVNRIEFSGEPKIIDTLKAEGFLIRVDKTPSIDRQDFFQNPFLWHRNGGYVLDAERWTTTGQAAHPARPSIAPGVLYRRYIPSLKKHLSFETLDLGKHLDHFHEWQNQKRVAFFWELDKPKAELESYLTNVHADPHHVPLIAALDGEPSGYFEVYWTAEDRLGPYYDCQPYDRGFHFLIGNKAHLGRTIFAAFLESITHFMFLEDARTRTALAEPRSDNAAVLKYLAPHPFWVKRFEFDFPHKRAALLASRREDFFAKARFQ